MPGWHAVSADGSCFGARVRPRTMASRHGGSRRPHSSKSKTSKGHPPSRGTKHASDQPASARKTATRRATARIKQAFVASTELRPMAQQLATMRTPAAYAGVTSVCARAYRRGCGRCLPGAGTRLSAGQALHRCGGQLAPGAPGGRRDWRTMRIFWPREANHEAGNEAAAEALLHGFSSRYPDSIFDAQAPELEANVLLAMNERGGRAASAGAAAGTVSADRPGFQLAQGQIAFALGQTAGGGADLQAAVARASVEQRGGDCARQADGDGRRDQPDDGRTAQPGRCLLQRRPLLLRQRSNITPWRSETGLDALSRERICRGRGGLRSEAEAADQGRG